MEVKNIDIQIDPEYTMHKKIKDNLFLSKEEMDILDRFNINYINMSSLSELIYELEIIEEDNVTDEDLMKIIKEDNDDDLLSNLLDVLSERNYYENYKK